MVEWRKAKNISAPSEVLKGSRWDGSGLGEVSKAGWFLQKFGSLSSGVQYTSK